MNDEEHNVVYYEDFSDCLKYFITCLKEILIKLNIHNSLKSQIQGWWNFHCWFGERQEKKVRV